MLKALVNLFHNFLFNAFFFNFYKIQFYKFLFSQLQINNISVALLIDKLNVLMAISKTVDTSQLCISMVKTGLNSLGLVKILG